MDPKIELQYSEYRTPNVKIDIEFFYDGYEGACGELLPHQLTIRNDHPEFKFKRWELLSIDIPFVEQMYWSLKTLAPIAKQYFEAIFGHKHDIVSRCELKLRALHKRISSYTIKPRTPQLDSCVFGEHFLKNEFESADNDAWSLSDFVTKIQSIMEDLCKITVQSNDPFCLHISRINQFNKDFTFIRRNAEDFFIFLRFFKDLSLYARNRQELHELSMYKLELAQVRMVNRSLEIEFKKFTHPLTITEICCMFDKMYEYGSKNEHE